MHNYFSNWWYSTEYYLQKLSGDLFEGNGYATLEAI